MQPISPAVEEKIITAITAMSIAGDPPGQIASLGGLVRGRHVRPRPNVQIVEPGQDFQLISVPNHRTPISSRVICHINPQGWRLDIAELGRVIHLVSLVTA